MKRKLPQWLLDATNNNDKSAKPNPTVSLRKNSKESHNDHPPDIHNQDEAHSTPVNAPSEQNPSNGTIAIVPLANLLSPSRGGIQVSESHRNVSNETELRTADSTSTEMPVPFVIKTETPDANDPIASNGTDQQLVIVKQEIKDEPMDTATSNVTPPQTVVPKVEDVKPERRSCNYGIKCYRRNADHRTELAHPGDVDYRRPPLPNAAGTPACPWGAACYRRNPQHFIQLSHPPANIYNPTAITTTTTAAITVNTVPPVNLPQRNRNATGNGRMVVGNDNSDVDEDDYDLEDPFINDGSSDEYVPEGDDDDDDDEDDSQVIDS